MVNVKVKWGRRGDTIVEVTIAILIVGVILGGAYVAANRYFKNIRKAQEYSTALKIAEGQIEQIKSRVASGQSTPFTQASPYCLLNGAFQDATNVSNCRTSDAIPYDINISRTGDNSVGFSFIITVSWTNINGGSDSTLSLRYRMYQ